MQLLYLQISLEHKSKYPSPASGSQNLQLEEMGICIITTTDSVQVSETDVYPLGPSRS